MERNDCAIVRDLIPMYGEDLLSEETRDYMRDHIEHCGECRKYLEQCLREVQARNLRALRRVLRECPDASVAVGTHGTALSTLLNAYDPGFGHADFERIKTLMPWAVHFTFFGEECAGIEEINLFTQEVKIRKEVVASYELETL